MKNSEKNTIKKDKRIISLKEKFLIKTVEEDNSLSVDKMFSESSYNNFIKTFEKMEDLVRKTNKAMVIQNYNAVDEEISDKLSELKYEKVFEEENNFKANQEKLEKNIDTFLDFLEENENDIYSTSFELNGKLRNKLEYLCDMYGIEYILQEESYTSKASFFDRDDLPVYNADNPQEYIFSGRRVKRGLYMTKKGNLINADVNGALNILRKSNVVDLTVLCDRGELDTPKRIRII